MPAQSNHHPIGRGSSTSSIRVRRAMIARPAQGEREIARSGPGSRPGGLQAGDRGEGSTSSSE